MDAREDNLSTDPDKLWRGNGGTLFKRGWWGKVEGEGGGGKGTQRGKEEEMKR